MHTRIYHRHGFIQHVTWHVPSHCRHACTMYPYIHPSTCVLQMSPHTSMLMSIHMFLHSPYRCPYTYPYTCVLQMSACRSRIQPHISTHFYPHISTKMSHHSSILMSIHTFIHMSTRRSVRMGPSKSLSSYYIAHTYIGHNYTGHTCCCPSGVTLWYPIPHLSTIQHIQISMDTHVLPPCLSSSETQMSLAHN